MNIFVDESGSDDHDRLFTCAAVLVDDAQLDDARAAVEDIAQRYASGGEIKSKNIGDNHPRRIRMLEAVQDIDFQFAGLVVDKRAIGETSGLRFRKSFNKYFKRLLQRPFDAYGGTGIRIAFDKYGWPSTMDEFERYMMGRVAPSLLFGYEPSHVDSRDERLVQLADLIAGSINWCFDPGRRCEESSIFRELLASKQLSLTGWPYSEYEAAQDDSADDVVLARQAQGRARVVIARLGNSSNESDSVAAAILDELLFARLFEAGARQSVYAEQLVSLLSDRGIEIATRQVRQSIGAIRDAGVVVAGSANGYKLALTSSDVGEYLTHTEGIVGPMLSRVRRARESIKLDSSGSYDILSGFSSLDAMLKAVDELNLDSMGARFGDDDIDEGSEL